MSALAHDSSSQIAQNGELDLADEGLVSAPVTEAAYQLLYENKNGSLCYWKVSQSGAQYITERGLFETTRPRVIERTCSETGSLESQVFRTAEENCSLEVERLIRTQLKRYHLDRADLFHPDQRDPEYVPKVGKGSSGRKLKKKPQVSRQTKLKAKISTRARAIDWGKIFGTFRASKPTQWIADDKHRAIYDAGNALYPVKYKGVGATARHEQRGWRFYTLDNEEITDPMTDEAAEQLASVGEWGVGTILHGEANLFFGGPGRLEDQGRTSGYLFASKEERARGLASGKYVRPTFVAFDMIFHNKKDLGFLTHDERAELYEPYLSIATESESPIVRAEYYDHINPDNWREYVEGSPIEGLILIDRSVRPGDIWGTKSSHKRPDGKWKLKLRIDEDVVMYAVHCFEDGTPRSVFVKQRDPATNRWFQCGKVPVSGRKVVIDALTPLLDRELPAIRTSKDLKDPQIAKRLKERGVDITEIQGVAVAVTGDQRFATGRIEVPKFETDDLGSEEVLRLRPDKAHEDCTPEGLPVDVPLSLSFIE